MFVDSKGKRFYNVQLKDVISLRDLTLKMFLRTWWWGIQALYFFCAIQGPTFGILWSKQNNWKNDKEKSWNLLVRTFS
jgi:hypothetical protein